MKYRVHIECRNEHMTECIAYVVQAETATRASDHSWHKKPSNKATR